MGASAFKQKGEKTMKTKRIAAIFLSLITAISLTTQTFADVVDPNAKADDGGTVAGDSELPGYDNTYDYGYRVSVVDQNGKSLGAADLLDPRINSITDAWGSSTGTDKGSSGQLVDQRTLPAGMPAPLSFTGSSFEGQGNAVKNYLTKKNSNGVENVVAIAQASFDGVYSGDELVKDLQSGDKQLIVEPILSLPSYTDEPIGTTRQLENGKTLHVVQVTNPASGRVYKYWATEDGSAYTYTGTIREFVQEELGPHGSIKNNFVGGVIKQTLKSFMFNDDAFNLKSLSESEIDALIEKICENPDLLDELAAGAFAFSNKQAAPPPQQPTPTPSTGNLDITESRITRHKKLSEVNNTLSNHSFKWDVPAFTIEQCNYNYTHCTYKKITDNTNVVNIDEKEKPEENEGVIGESKYWSFMGATLYSGFEKTWSDRQWGEQNFSFDGAEYSITAIKKNDRLNLIDYNNRNGVAAGVIQNATSFVGSGNISSNRAANGSGAFNVSLSFEPDTGVYKWTGNEYDDETTAKHTDCYDYYKPDGKGGYIKDSLGNNKVFHDPDPREETIQTNFDTSTKLEMNLAVNWSVYAGTQNTASSTPAAGFTQIFKNGKQETWLELNYGTVEFVPYIKMQFDTPTTKGSQVYVAGKYPRSFTANEHVGVIFNTSKNTGNSIVNTQFGTKNGKITLQSNQWSTHAEAVKNAGSNCVLSGGVVLDLAILKDDRQTFTVESIKPILVGDGLKQVNATTNRYDLPTNDSQAKTEHDYFVQQVVKALEGLSVQQYISGTLSNPTSITKDVWDMPGKKAVSPKPTTDSKYYFRPDSDSDTDPKKNGKSNAGDIDVKQGNTEIVYYTFFSNTAGNIKYKKGYSLLDTSTIDPDNDGTLILSKGQTGITDKTIYNINEKTHIVDNLRKAIERNTGSDSDAAWVSDGHWYNEAFDGITIIYQKTTLSLGTINPYVRSAVLDPELCPSSTSKSDLFTKYVASQFKMRDYSEVYGSGKVGKLAEYKGYEFTTQKLDQLFISDIFYIPNVTVQDLR